MRTCSLSGELFAGGSASALLQLLSGLPVILGAMFLIRGGLMWLEAPLLSLLGPRMSWQVGGFWCVCRHRECMCVCVGGGGGGVDCEPALHRPEGPAVAATAQPEHAGAKKWVAGVWRAVKGAGLACLQGGVVGGWVGGGLVTSGWGGGSVTVAGGTSAQPTGTTQSWQVCGLSAKLKAECCSDV